MKERILRRIQELREKQANVSVAERAQIEKEISRLWSLIS